MIQVLSHQDTPDPHFPSLLSGPDGLSDENPIVASALETLKLGLDDNTVRAVIGIESWVSGVAWISLGGPAAHPHPHPAAILADAAELVYGHFGLTSLLAFTLTPDEHAAAVQSLGGEPLGRLSALGTPDATIVRFERRD